MHDTNWINFIISTLALGVGLGGGVLDLQSRRIPNRLTVSALVIGLTANALAWGWPGLKNGLEGAGLCLAVLLPIVLVRGLGAGDWKFMGALGAFVGFHAALLLLLGASLVAGAMALVEIGRSGRVRETASNLGVIAHAVVTFGIRPVRGSVTLDDPHALSLPYGVAAAIAMAGLYCLQFRII
jgi:prepilin peptidase CpaA